MSQESIGGSATGDAGTPTRPRLLVKGTQVDENSRRLAFDGSAHRYMFRLQLSRPLTPTEDSAWESEITEVKRDGEYRFGDVSVRQFVPAGDEIRIGRMTIDDLEQVRSAIAAFLRRVEFVAEAEVLREEEQWHRTVERVGAIEWPDGSVRP